MLNAANDGVMDVPAGPTGPTPPLAPTAVVTGLGSLSAPVGPSMWSRVSGTAKRFGVTWVFKYIVLFVLILIILLVVRPSFVMEKTTPTPDDPTVGQTYSWKAVIGLSVATVAAAVLLPMAYENRAKILGGVTSIGKTVKSAVLQ